LRSSSGQKHVDLDGVMMLFCSIVAIFLFAGVSYLWVWGRVIYTANIAMSDVSGQSMNMLLFGKMLIQNKPDIDYRKRLDKAGQFSEEGRLSHLFILGGCNPPNIVSEAFVGAEYLEANYSMDNVDIICEDHSRNTLENIKNARVNMRKRNMQLAILLLTNRYHLYRCQRIATNLGFSVVPVGAEERLKWTPEILYKTFLEAFLTHWYNTGLFISRLLGSERLLSKIQ
jgi:uncharacterized SAM-binding protein YcdF (DUF218 family)